MEKHLRGETPQGDLGAALLEATFLIGRTISRNLGYVGRAIKGTFDSYESFHSRDYSLK